MWAPQTLFESDSYDDLITGKIPALIVPEILSKTECSSLCSKISNIQTTNGNPKKFERLDGDGVKVRCLSCKKIITI